jgi:hypothetical protein
MFGNIPICWVRTNVGWISQEIAHHSYNEKSILFFLVSVCINFFKHSYFALNPRPRQLFARHFVCLSFSTFNLVEHFVKNENILVQK